ncbi:zincin [Schizophyllum commune H4-8]|uniref:deuterolysin n=1 Tax=Schizophyllum commune (strain H4-8 / FGSC 9210) TaxID=578458 RepID=D8QBZ3_SCHCM|nr:zincin [Schizophyllum commune H4-8]KAI5889373.1 zincin [Schizophyllum commune H4-8]
MPFLTSILIIALVGAAHSFPFNSSQLSSLRVDLTGSNNVSSFDALQLRAIVTNTGTQTLRLLKYQTVLDTDLPTNSFRVTKGEEEVPFIGIRLTISVPDLDDSAFATLAPGQAVEAVHNLSGRYDFSSSGEGVYSFDPVTDFMILDDDGLLLSASDFIDVQHPPTAQIVALHGPVAPPLAQKRATATCKDPAKAKFIDAAYTEAKSLAHQSSSYITSHGAGDDLYKQYYHGAPTGDVTSIFDAVANETSPSRQLSCDDPRDSCKRGMLGYTTFPDTNVYFCPPFFSEVPSENLCTSTTVNQRNVRGETMLHELTHALSHTRDLAYGCQSVQKLSDSSAPRNADSYAVSFCYFDIRNCRPNAKPQCFATEVYARTMCH